MKIHLTAIFSFAIFLSACAGPPADQPKAVTNVASNTNTAAPVNTANNAAKPAVQGEKLEINSQNSTVNFVGYKVTGKHDGGFKNLSGAINLVNAKPEESGVSVEIETNSIFSDDPGLTEHLKSPDFFDVAKFPKASFKSTRIEAGAQEPNNYMVTGDLDLHGVVKSIQFPARIDVTDSEAAVKIKFRLNRKDFQMNYPGKADNLISDEVTLALDVKAPRKK